MCARPPEWLSSFLAACLIVATVGCANWDAGRYSLKDLPGNGLHRSFTADEINSRRDRREGEIPKVASASTRDEMREDAEPSGAATTADPADPAAKPKQALPKRMHAADDPSDDAVILTQFFTREIEPAPDPPPIPSPDVSDSPLDDDGLVEGEPALAPPARVIPTAPTVELAEPVAVEPDPAGEICRLDFSSALAIASGQNPQVAFAGQRYREAYARLEAAKALWLPSIQAGVSYNKHEGVLQDVGGQVFEVSRGSLQSGFGVRAVGAGSPAVPGLVAQFHLSDAIFQPQIAGRIAAGRQEAARATGNDVLLETALAYLRLLAAVQEVAIARETLDHAQRLADLTKTYADKGQGAQADADRAKVEHVVRQNEVTRAEEEIQVASARLNQLLHFDPMTTILPGESTVVPVDLVPRETPLPDLLAIGLSNRPELAESQQLVCEALHRYRREKFAPLLPSAYLGVSYGGFGGGTGSRIHNFDDRFDVDAAAYWEVRNFGFGERAARDEMQARYEQARLREIEVMDRVAREIIEAHAQVRSRQEQIDVAETGIQAAADSYQRNVARIRAGEGLPIEVLQSIQALDQARREYLRTLVDHNEAQFRLQRALGGPIQ